MRREDSPGVFVLRVVLPVSPKRWTAAQLWPVQGPTFLQRFDLQQLSPICIDCARDPVSPSILIDGRVIVLESYLIEIGPHRTQSKIPGEAIPVERDVFSRSDFGRLVDHCGRRVPIRQRTAQSLEPILELVTKWVEEIHQSIR